MDKELREQVAELANLKGKAFPQTVQLRDLYFLCGPPTAARPEGSPVLTTSSYWPDYPNAPNYLTENTAYAQSAYNFDFAALHAALSAPTVPLAGGAGLSEEQAKAFIDAVWEWLDIPYQWFSEYSTSQLNIQPFIAKLKQLGLAVVPTAPAAPLQLGEAAAAEWISVEDRLPETPKGRWSDSMLTVNNHGNMNVRPYYNAESGKGWWLDEVTYDKTSWRVTHWQPLPTAPTQTGRKENPDA